MQNLDDLLKEAIQKATKSKGSVSFDPFEMGNYQIKPF